VQPSCPMEAVTSTAAHRLLAAKLARTAALSTLDPVHTRSSAGGYGRELWNPRAKAAAGNGECSTIGGSWEDVSDGPGRQ
jgi:hypothetical protein